MTNYMDDEFTNSQVTKLGDETRSSCFILMAPLSHGLFCGTSIVCPIEY